MSRDIRTFPGLSWLKQYVPAPSGGRGQYIMIELSEQYALRILGGQPLEYIGKTDFDIYDFDTAMTFFQNDEDTRLGRRNPTEPVCEPWESKFTGQRGTFAGLKWAYEFDGGVYLRGSE